MILQKSRISGNIQKFRTRGYSDLYRKNQMQPIKSMFGIKYHKFKEGVKNLFESTSQFTEWGESRYSGTKMKGAGFVLFRLPTATVLKYSMPRTSR